MKIVGNQTSLDQYYDYSLDERIDLIKQIPWKNGDYVKQSWPNWLHHMSPYAGRITPQIVHWLTKSFSNKNDVILDPFCGIGTVPLEANLLGRQSIGFDLNPYAFYISDAKMDRRPISEHIEFLESISIDSNPDVINEVPSWVWEYYNRKTLEEILTVIDILKERKKRFVLGCLLGVSQGHRIGHLSKASGLTLPLKPRADDPGEYKEVIPRLINKVKRMYKDGFPIEPVGKIQQIDSRNMPIKDNHVDCIITSPPYLDNLDYVSSNRLRLALLGYHGEKAKKLSKKLMYKQESYINLMNKVFREMSRVLKPKGIFVLIIGDVHKGKKHTITGNLIKESLKYNNFRIINEFSDTIPFNRSVQRTLRMQNSHLPNRLDRIMIISNEK